MTTDRERQEKARMRATRFAIAMTERAMHVSQVDACLMLPHVPPKRDANYWRGFRYCRPSDHGYQYSMGIGDAWSVKTLDRYLGYRGVGPYEYGLGVAHYPVPAVIGQVWYEQDRIGIEEKDDPDWTAIFWERD